MSILKDLSELQEAGIISPETADGIKAYYGQKRNTSGHRLFVIFGILGALLVGLGIILILAHNWDQLTRGTKTIIAFVPLGAGQLLCAYALRWRPESQTWRESAAVFLVFAVGASIALVSQIHNIPGDLGSFFLTWSLLTLPLIYVMNSSMTSLLYLLGITYYACHEGYWTSSSGQAYLYWLLLLAGLPHYYLLIKSRPASNFTTFHHWFVPLSVIICLGTLAADEVTYMWIAYFSLMGSLYLIGMRGPSRGKIWRNGNQTLGSLSTIVLLLIMSFDDFWSSLRQEAFEVSSLASQEVLIAGTLTALACVLLYLQIKRQSLRELQPASYIFLLYLLLFLIGHFWSVAVVFVNLTILALGIHTMLDGMRRTSLGTLNYGLLIIAALITCRFFDTDLSFVLRGLLFVTVGVGFFTANYWMLKRIKANED